MSAADVIEKIKGLSPAEFEIVRNFFVNGASESTNSGKVNYIDRSEALEIGARVMDENEELFRKLAE